MKAIDMAKDPAFLFYYQDFLVGTEFMTNEEVGVYIRILAHQADKGHLTEKQVLSICRGYAFTDTLKSKFIKDTIGNYYNVRLDEEMQKRRNFSESRRNNALGKKAYAEHMEDENENRNENIIEYKDGFVIPEKLDTPEFIESFNEFIKYRKKIKKPLSDMSAKKQIKKLSEFSVNDAIKMIDQTIANGWQGIFEVKDGSNRQGNQSGFKQINPLSPVGRATFQHGKEDVERFRQLEEELGAIVQSKKDSE
jgi:uncharacterized protein YdaU (DUF1376 family)